MFSRGASPRVQKSSLPRAFPVGSPVFTSCDAPIRSSFFFSLFDMADYGGYGGDGGYGDGGGGYGGYGGDGGGGGFAAQGSGGGYNGGASQGSGKGSPSKVRGKREEEEDEAPFLRSRFVISVCY
jgi:hypothetical protein